MSGFSWNLALDRSFLFNTFPLFILVSIISAAPSLCFFVMLAWAYHLFKSYDTVNLSTTRYFIPVAAWVTGYTAAGAYSIYKMFELYAALPTSPPDCYVATAAAQGHPALVRSHPVQLPGGRLRVNAQLQTLKAAELVILALAPGFHRPLRAAYDLAGRFLARRLKHAILADLAYLSLKPAEWLARILLNLLLPQWQSFASRLYI